MSSKVHYYYPATRCSPDEVAVQEIYDEVVVYDLKLHKAHSLNHTAALVWRWCDGKTSTAAMTERLATHLNLSVEQAEPVLWLSLDRLQKAHLLDGEVTIPSTPVGITRRQALKWIGGAALLPVVYTLVAPTAAQAATNLPLGESCTTSNECASGCCKKSGAGENTCVTTGSGSCI
ncbi:MAG: PqqD family protein [Caldilineales bacterium]|nr:PqqD family protein [Caldilineales bacterium]